jgi:murein DD-endopeptidase MepM/ murein hydrolase activator NlpD
LEAVRRWLQDTAAPWLTNRRSRVTHGAALVLGLSTLALTLAGSGGAATDLSYLAYPDDAGTNGGVLRAAAEAAASEEGAEPALAREEAPFYTHEVQAGDTLFAIAEEYGVSVDYLLWNNPELTADPDLLIVGKNLLVPGVEGIVYDVRLGDTVTDIALTYGIDPATIIDYEHNALDAPDSIIEGMVLVLPGGVPPPPPAPEPEPVAEPAPEPAPAADPPPASGPLPAGIVTPPPPPPPAAVIVPSVGYIWPVAGSLNSYFGPRWGSFHKGIDIGAPSGTPVASAASGQVVLATYRDNGYGNYVIVRHDDGSQTLYAHLSAIWVALGQYVNQGDLVGAVGCTGWCTGNHLHFEIIIGGSPVNPLHYLP